MNNIKVNKKSLLNGICYTLWLDYIIIAIIFKQNTTQENKCLGAVSKLCK